jgi:hypothetical protein
MRALSVLLVTVLVAPALLLAGCCGTPCCDKKDDCCPDKCETRYTK